MSTYTPLASITLSAAASSVTFSGIPQTYTDLVLVLAGAQNTAGSNYIELNSDTGTNYSYTFMYGDGTSAASSRDSSKGPSQGGILFYFGTDQNNAILNFQNYSNTTTYKTILSRSNGSGYTSARVGLWRSTSAITQIKVYAGSTNTFNSGTTFNLYGIDAQASAQAKATGGQSIYTDGTYWYHIFNQSGTFTPTQALTADYLVVAGGGGGGTAQGDGNFTWGGSGGGGAGGMRCTVTATGGGGSLESALSLIAQAYTVTVGAGGAGGTAGGNNAGTQGSNSVFSTITSTGGGFGGFSVNTGAVSGGNGGSGGGGGACNTGVTSNGGTGTSNQGYNGGGGQAANANPYRGGGGGGAGSVGISGTTSGNGGSGVATSISSSSVTYAGGGGGGAQTTASGTGGSGGGGNGALAGTSDAVSGSANRGAGGGGGVASTTASQRAGGNGGSGIVIIRYAV